MPDLEQRFRSLSRTNAPELWPEIESRPPGPLPPSPPGRRLVAGATALVVAVAGFAFVLSSFADRTPQPPADESHAPIAISNGQIAVAEGADQDIVLIDPESGISTPLVDRHGAGFEGSLHMAWSPDGSRLAYTDRSGGDSPGLFVLDLATGAVRDLTQGVLRAHSPAWSPDGSQIAFTGIGFPAGYEIYVVAPDGSGLRRVTDHPDNGVDGAYTPNWSPDGSQIAFSWNRYDRETESESSGIAVVDLETVEQTKVTDTPDVDESPVWSPDGSRIAFLRKVAGGAQVFVVNADGSGERSVSDAGLLVSVPSWYADGSRFVFGFSSLHTSDEGMVVVEVDDGGAQPLLGEAFAGWPIWAPAGDLIAFPHDDAGTGRSSIWTVRPDGSELVEIANGLDQVSDIAWQPLTEPAEVSSVVPTSAAIVETLRVGEDVRSVAYGEGSAWVAVSNNDGSFAGRILRIDPESDAIQADIPVDVIPTWEVGGGAMVVADGSLWVTGGLEQPGDFDDPGGGADAAVIRIDSASEQVVQTIELDGVVGADLAFLDGDLWVLLFGDETVDHSMEVVRVDPTSGVVLARIPLTASWAQRIVPAAGRLVVIEGGDDAVNVGGHLTSIDPATNAVAARTAIESDYSAHGPAQWRDQIWVSVEDGFSRFDPITGDVVDHAPTPDPSRLAACCLVLEADDRGIWFLGSDGGSGGGRRSLDLFDPETGEVVELLSLSGTDTPVAMAVAPDSVWILNYAGTLTHVALS